MQITQINRWDVSPTEAIAIQNELRRRVVITPAPEHAGLVAGVDVGVRGEQARAAVVVLRFPELAVVERSVVDAPLQFPYVPGLLSFREIPAVLQACERLQHMPDLLIVDGQGYAHPRRLGIAAHLGVILNLPTIGCAKSRLVGTYVEPASAAGSWSDLWDKGEVIGAVLRSKDSTSPLYVSIGHRVDLDSAIRWVLACCRGYRLPETSRQAHRAASASES